MKKILSKLMVPLMILVMINMIGLVFHKNYEGAVAGSLLGMIVAILVLEIRAKIE